MAAFELVRPRLKTGYRILEVGCGTGNVLRALQRAATGGVAIGMDLEVEGLRHAQRRLDRPLLVVGDAAHPPYGVKFEVIGAFDVIEHIDDDVEVLRRLRELLTPEGRLLITVPAGPELWSYFDVAARHRRRYTVRELKSKLESAGYSIDYITPYMSVLHPLVWAGRRFAALRGRETSARPEALIQEDLRVRPWAGNVLLALLAQELRFIRRRRSLPIGTSLLAVARRS